jgi:predicted transposase/invertase (TIGR01784 family)
MKKDIITKDTIKIITEDIAKYILELDVSDIEFVDKELQRVEKREADIVAHCKIKGKEAILHLEIQNDNDKAMHQRMLRYYTDIKQRYDTLPLFQYLVYIGKPKLTMQDQIVEENLTFRYNIVDMHTIDCEKFIKMDTPDALVLAILCDFKDKDEKVLLTYIVTRLQELTKDNTHGLGKYLLALEELSNNRNLKEKLKEVENMLRDMKLEELPSYEIGMERGISRGMTLGITQGISQGIIATASMMIKEFHLSVEQVANKLNISIDELRKHLEK